MAIQDISNLPISQSFQNILQVSSSEVGTATGIVITDLDVTSSYADSAITSISASYALTASYAANVPETASYAISSSHANQADSSLTAVSSSHALNSDVAVSASYSSTADAATSASHAVNADNAISASHAIQADSATSASRAENAGIVGLFNESITDGIQFQVLRTDGAGNLSFEFADRTQIEVRASEAIAKGDPLYVVGFNIGQNRIEVAKADASDPSKMPAYGLAYEAVPINTNTQMLSIGTLDDIDTQVTYDFQVGDTVYVAAGGGLTNVKPTGTNLIQNVGVVGRRNQNNGEIVVSAIGRSNDVPNIATGGVWVGNTNGVAAVVQTGSLSVATASLTLGVDTNANLNIATISASSAVFQSASIGYLQSVTGSAKIIGDAYIILNNATPTERYAGLVVQDSGSGAPNTTASLEFDGQSNDWFYEYSDDGGVTTDHGVVIFGPEYNTKGAPTYLTEGTIPKSTGSHHIVDSNITDDGTTIVLGSNSEVTGSLGVTGIITGTLNGQASTAISASHAVNADSSLTANTATTAGFASTAATASYVAAANVDGTVATATSASHAVQADSALTATTATTASYVAGADVDGTVATATSASYAVSASHADNVPDGIITNSTDTYTSVADVQHIITLTAAEYSAIGTPDANTFYIVI